MSGIAFFLETLPRFFSFPISGILCDHCSPYKILNYSQKIRFLIIPLGLLGHWLADSVYWLIAISALSGAATSFGMIAREVIIPQAFKLTRLEKTLSFTSLSDQLGVVIGPILAVSLLTLMRWEWVLVLTALLFLGSDILSQYWWRFKKPNVQALNSTKMELFHSIYTAFKHVMNLNGLFSAIILAFSINLILGTTLSTVVPIYTGVFNQSEFSYGLLQVIGALCSIFIVVYIANFSIRLPVLGGIGFIAIAIGAAITALADNHIIYFAGFVLIVSFDKMFNIFVRALRVKVIPPDELGKTTGVIILLNNISQPLAGAFIALSATMIAVQSAVLYLNMAAVLLGVCVLIYSIIKIKP